MNRKTTRKETDMAIKLDDFSAYTDFAKRAFTPATRFNERSSATSSASPASSTSWPAT